MQDGQGNVIDVTDFSPRFYLHGRMFAPAMVVRVIKRIAGRPRIALCLRPMINYGQSRAEVRCGAHHVTYYGGAQAMRVTTDASITALTEERQFFFA